MPETNAYLSELEAELRAAVPATGAAPFLYDMLRYHLGWLDRHGRPVQAPAGKRLRPLLCLLACEGYGGDYRRALPAAAAIELLHNFTLIHDDVQDRSDERRHRPTVWRLWGEAQAINAGDALYALARLALLRLAERGLAPSTVTAAAALLDHTCLRICEGQSLDVAFEGRLDVTYDEYLAMIGGKTAALLGCALEMGALVAGAAAEERQRMRECGETLGLAYQVQDDILGIWGEPSVTGKPAADDIRGRKKTLPIVYALTHGDRQHVERLHALFAAAALDEGDVAAVLRILEDTGARQAAEAEAGRLYDETQRLLQASALAADVRSALSELVRSLLRRPA